MQEQDEAEAAANEGYIRALFQAEAEPNQDPSMTIGDGKGSQKRQAKEKKAQLLNECLADADFERFGNLLAK